MKIREASQGRALVELDLEDLRLLNNALNEICNGIDLEEFETRMGFSRAEATAALGRIQDLSSRVSR